MRIRELYFFLSFHYQKLMTDSKPGGNLGRGGRFGCRCSCFGRLGRFFLLVVSNEGLDLSDGQHLDAGTAVLASQCRQLQLVWRQLSGVHSFAHHFDGQCQRGVQIRLPFLVLLWRPKKQDKRVNLRFICDSCYAYLLQHGDSSGAVVSDAGSLPSAVVTRRVGLVELETILVIPSGIKERDAEGSLPAVLCVRLLDVAEPRDELLAGDGLPVL